MIGLLPTAEELLSRMDAAAYMVNEISDSHFEVFCKLNTNHPLVPVLAEYSLLHLHGLMQLNHQAGQGLSIKYLLNINLHDEVEKLEHRGRNNYQGWVGELTTDYLLSHLISSHRQKLGYDWCLVEPPKGDVNDHGLDIIAVYERTGIGLGHISGEIKTYQDLSQAKNDAYKKLREAQAGSRDAEIRRALNALLATRKGIDPVSAALMAMNGEHSFLPSVLHDEANGFSRKDTFHDIKSVFPTCQRSSARIGMQISIRDFPDFFDRFLEEMKTCARRFEEEANKSKHV